MVFLVCKFKDDGVMFVTSRKSREIMINVLLDIGGEIESIVLKECESFDEAMKYKTDLEEADRKINGVL
jgi:hypothetical protein